MATSDPRHKMISLRLSEMEYEGLKSRYRSYGARNVSDLARLALRHIMAGTALSTDGFGAKVLELDQRVRLLESRLALLSDPGKPEL